MKNTSKTVCRVLADLLVKHGVETVFSSPGSRNAPLIVACSCKKELKMHPIVDERSAAFMAMGYSLLSDRPVALICTSGSALLNYLPAVAEAFYRKVPLIVVSADRPLEWIDQDDSQTIKQSDALENFVKNSYDITDSENNSDRWYANRLINDALMTATTGRKAPVHINVRLSEPIGDLVDTDEEEVFRSISFVEPRQDMRVADVRELAKNLASPKKVLIVAGFLAPDNVLNRALNKLAGLDNVAVLTESISNLHGMDFVESIDSVLSTMTPPDKEASKPDVVITLGGAIVSRFVKTYLRTYTPSEHWHVGLSHTTIDCFCSLTRRIEMLPSVFFQQLSSAMQPHRQPSDYKENWLMQKKQALKSHKAFVDSAPWSDLKAFSILIRLLPSTCNLQISNGTSIRYMQLFANRGFHRSDCNRGVSGIDGSTSTAIGAAMATPRSTTVLITGDISAQYDISALSYAEKVPNLRIIVMMNGGGSIFRFISATDRLPQLEDYLTIDRTFPVKEIAAAYKIRYYEAKNEAELEAVFPSFIDVEKRSASLLALYTPTELNAKILKEYFKRT